MDLKVSVLADNPQLMEIFWDMPSPWPEFMKWDPIGNRYYGLVEEFGEFILVFQDDAGDIVAKAYAAPFVLGDRELPDAGWDAVILSALQAKITGQTPDAVSAIEIVIRPDLQGTGLSGRVLAAMRANVARLGFGDLYAPVRPNGKSDLDRPMTDYAFRTREDGLPVDPWLRVHVRAGGEIVKVAPRSMVIPGSLAQWREWTGLPFDRTGAVHVPKALAPVMCQVEHDHAVYVEPNVWVRHKIGGAAE